MNTAPPPEQLTAMAERVLAANRMAGRRIAVAESCTGGLVAAALVDPPGASDVFVGGVVAYADEAKTRLLGVDPDVIATFGAVSIAVAWAMARSMLERSQADVAVAITGIAGPNGGSDRKPVGTVVFARAERGCDPEEVTADTRLFEGLDRTGVRRQAALVALELLLPSTAAPVGP